MKKETLLACRRLFDEHQTALRQPQGGNQSAGQPAEALLPGEEAAATPVLRQPLRDLRQPRAERLLHAEHEEAQRWRAQAVRLGEELHSAHSAARSERRAFAAQLHRARTSMAGAVSQFEHDRAQIARLARLSQYFEEQFLQSAAARDREATAAKIAHTEVFMAAQEVVLQRRDEQQARAAAEQRAADLERELSAKQRQVQDLEDQCRRSADKAVITQQLGSILKAEREARAAAEQRAADLGWKLSAQQTQADKLEDQCRRISAEKQEVTDQLEALFNAEREARAAAEQSAADLEQKLEAQQIQLDVLGDQCRRITAEKEQVTEQCKASVSAEREARTAAQCRAADLELRLEAEGGRIHILERENRRISAEKEQVTEQCKASVSAEREARTAAERRAADLELRVEAESLRMKELEGENRRIRAENAQVSRDFEVALLALGSLDLNASQACSEEVEQLIPKSQAAQDAAKKEAQRAADLAASRTAMEQQLADPLKSYQVGIITFPWVFAQWTILGS